ncbi:hypothetical protein HYH03_006578 [Edaphochlamys debaryana]|uniref:Uncharacterized protein n=1 Tax=Edaphochlamys debaryana TaxID=47281 RepID=A0A835Y6Z2_9CHLO|nr:hypothetical protein HYH03_006578 [Edaphochlamys debaryana]|eukprot:KAG2495306.1 hypothetical protein HYH03_006578 [Edaphochlamys debaryana]
MMLARAPVSAARGATARPRLAGASSPSLRPLAPRRATVIRRFQASSWGLGAENNQETEIEMQKRRAREDQIRKQEELINQMTKNTTESARDEIKKDVGKVVDTVDRTSAGKGYSPAHQVPLWMPAFTRRREVFVGRIAMLGFFASCVLETFTANHLGPIRQVQLWSGLDESTIVTITLGIVAYNVLGALGPWSPTFSPENLRDVAKRPHGPPNAWTSPLDLGRFLGISGWGFTKRNELFHGRLAMIGFLFAFVNEIKTGMGPLGQVASYLGIYPDNAWYSLCSSSFLIFTALMLATSVAFPSRLQGSAASEDEIY